MAAATSSTESDMFHQLVFPFDEDLDPQAARALLRIRFDRQATKQINQLLRKNQRGTISTEERLVLEKFLHMGKFIDVVQAKARKALKKAGASE
jgi:polyphosphate kinase